MKIGLSFITLASAAVFALGASAAQARDAKVGEGQATTAQTQAAKAAALWYQAEAHYYEGLRSNAQLRGYWGQVTAPAQRSQTRHQTMHCSIPPDERTGTC